MIVYLYEYYIGIVTKKMYESYYIIGMDCQCRKCFMYIRPYFAGVFTWVTKGGRKEFTRKFWAPCSLAVTSEGNWQRPKFEADTSTEAHDQGRNPANVGRGLRRFTKAGMAFAIYLLPSAQATGSTAARGSIT